MNLRTVQQVVQENPAFTEGGVRWDIFNAKTNGLDDYKAVIRRGRRVYLDIDAYHAWIQDGCKPLARRT